MVKPPARGGLSIGLLLVVVAAAYTADIALANGWLTEPRTPLWSFDQASPAEKAEFVRLGRRQSIEIDTRTTLEFIDELREQKTQAVPANVFASRVNEAGDQSISTSPSPPLLPLGGISNSFIVLCKESGQYVVYKNDEHGFRNPQGIWNAARADVAAVGQSFVQGYCVPDGTGFVDLLRRRYPVTLNLGMSGESPVLQLAAIKEFLPRYEPRIVLWFFAEGIDLGDLASDATHHPWLIHYLEPAFGQSLLTRQPEIDRVFQRAASEGEQRLRQKQPSRPDRTLIERGKEIIKLWHLRKELSLAYGINSGGISTDAPSEATLDLFSKALAQAKMVTRSWGGTLYFVYLPSWNRYRNDPRVAERERTRVLKVAKALEIPIVDVQPAFQEQKDPLSLFPFRRFGHYNQRGNEIVAATVLQAVSGVH
jgi:hypothetical protein